MYFPQKHPSDKGSIGLGRQGEEVSAIGASTRSRHATTSSCGAINIVTGVDGKAHSLNCRRCFKRSRSLSDMVSVNISMFSYAFRAIFAFLPFCVFECKYSIFFSAFWHCNQFPSVISEQQSHHSESNKFKCLCMEFAR